MSSKLMLGEHEERVAALHLWSHQGLMDTWLYSGAGKLWALTRDQDGLNLPDHLGPWDSVRLVTLHGEDDDEQKAMALIEKHGFCCFE